MDYSKTSAVTGNLKLAADSLDVTGYYDLFAGKPKPATNTAATRPQPAAPPAAGANQEPAAVELPFKNFTFDASIGQFYLHEMAITNLQAAIKIDGGRVVVKPCQLALNGAPVSASADLDLGVAGWKYDVSFEAQKVPLAPLVNSFQPERKGQIGGVLTANAQVKGAGTTGAGLQKNLTGQFDLVATNLNFSIANVRSPTLNSLVNVIVGIPDLVRSPGAAVGNLLGRAAGGGSRTGGWADEFTAAPIDLIAVHGSAGNGAINLKDTIIQSRAFQARVDNASQALTLAENLTNSTLQIPVLVSLRRDLADKVNLVPPGTPTNAAYAALPSFLTMKGTVGKPNPDINKLALVGLAAKSGIGGVKQTAGASVQKTNAAVNAVEGLGSLLGGSTSSNQTANTNTNKTTRFNPFNSRK